MPYMGLGIQMVLTMVLFVAGGYYLDRWLDTAPWLLLAGALLGMVAVFAFLLRLADRLSNTSNPRPKNDQEDPSDDFREPPR